MDAKTLLGLGAIGGAVYLATSKKAKVKKTTGLSDRKKSIKDVKNENEALEYVESLKSRVAKNNALRWFIVNKKWWI